MSKRFFTNRDGNTLIKEFQGVLSNNPNIKNLDSVVGFLRASGYFSLRPFLNSINKSRILIGIDVDKYIVQANNAGTLFFWERKRRFAKIILNNFVKILNTLATVKRLKTVFVRWPKTLRTASWNFVHTRV